MSFKEGSVQAYVDGTYDMEIISITDLLEEYEFSPDILKMDCEGCEYEIIQNHDLSMFNEIIFEHHSVSSKRDPEILISILKKQGFKINCHAIKASSLDFDEIGIIHAFKD